MAKLNRSQRQLFARRLTGLTNPALALWFCAKPLIIIEKNGEGSFRGAFPPPVLPQQNFSPLSGRPKKRVVSKGFAGAAGDCHLCRAACFVLSLACFSESWGLRQFSTQLVNSMFPRACAAAGRVPVRERDRYAEGSSNVPRRLPVPGLNPRIRRYPRRQKTVHSGGVPDEFVG